MFSPSMLSSILTAVHVKRTADNIQALSAHFSFTLPISSQPVLHIHLQSAPGTKTTIPRE